MRTKRKEKTETVVPARLLLDNVGRESLRDIRPLFVGSENAAHVPQSLHSPESREKALEVFSKLMACWSEAAASQTAQFVKSTAAVQQLQADLDTLRAEKNGEQVAADADADVLESTVTTNLKERISALEVDYAHALEELGTTEADAVAHAEILTTKIAELENASGALSGKVAALEGDNADIREQLNAAESDAVAHAEILTARNAELERNNSALAERVTALDGDSVGARDQFGAAQSEAAAHAETFTSRIEALEEENGSLKEKVAALEGDSADVREEFGAAEADAVAHTEILTTRIAELENENGALSGKVTTLEGDNADIRVQLTAAESDAVAHAEILTARNAVLERDNSALKERTTALDGDSAGARDQLGAAQSEAAAHAEALTTRIGVLEEENDSLKEKVAALEGDSAAVRGGLGAAEADAVAHAEILTTRIAELENETGVLGVKVSTLEGDNAGIREQLTAAESDAVAHAEILTARNAELERDNSALNERFTALDGDSAGARDQFEASQSEAAAHAETLTTRIGALEEENGSLREKVAALEGDNVSVREQLGTAESDAVAHAEILTAKSDELERDNGSLRERVAAMDGDCAGVREQLQAAESEAVAREDILTARIAVLDNEAAALKEASRHMEETVQAGGEAALRVVGAKLSASEEALSEKEVECTALVSSVSGLQSDIEAIQARARDLEQQAVTARASRDVLDGEVKEIMRQSSSILESMQRSPGGELPVLPGDIMTHVDLASTAGNIASLANGWHQSERAAASAALNDAAAITDWVRGLLAGEGDAAGVVVRPEVVSEGDASDIVSLVDMLKEEATRDRLCVSRVLSALHDFEMESGPLLGVAPSPATVCDAVQILMSTTMEYRKRLSELEARCAEQDSIVSAHTERSTEVTGVIQRVWSIVATCAEECGVSVPIADQPMDETVIERMLDSACSGVRERVESMSMDCGTLHDELTANAERIRILEDQLILKSDVPADAMVRAADAVRETLKGRQRPVPSEEAAVEAAEALRRSVIGHTGVNANDSVSGPQIPQKVDVGSGFEQLVKRLLAIIDGMHHQLEHVLGENAELQKMAEGAVTLESQMASAQRGHDGVIAEHTQRECDLREELERVRADKDDLQVSVTRLGELVENVRENSREVKLALQSQLEAQRLASTEKIQSALDEAQRFQTMYEKVMEQNDSLSHSNGKLQLSVDNLTAVVDDMQRVKSDLESRLVSRRLSVDGWSGRMETFQTLATEAREREASLVVRVDEVQSEAARAAARVSRLVDENEVLRTNCAELTERLAACLDEAKRKEQEPGSDVAVVSSLLFSYLDRTSTIVHEHRVEVLRLIAGILGWDDTQKRSVGMHVPLPDAAAVEVDGGIIMSSLMKTGRSLMSSILSTGDASEAVQRQHMQEAADGSSLEDLWVRFLLREVDRADDDDHRERLESLPRDAFTSPSFGTGGANADSVDGARGPPESVSVSAAEAASSSKSSTLPSAPA